MTVTTKNDGSVYVDGKLVATYSKKYQNVIGKRRIMYSVKLLSNGEMCSSDRLASLKVWLVDELAGRN